MPQAEGKRNVSLRSRVILLTAVCVAGAVALASIGAFMVVSSNLNSQVAESLEITVKQAAGTLQSGQYRGLAPIGPTDLTFALLDESGMTTETNRSPIRLSTTEQDLVDSPPGTCSPQRTDTAATVLVMGCTYAPGKAVVAAQSLKPTQGVLQKLALVLVFVGIGGVLVAALAGTAVAQGGLRPVTRLRQATEHITATGDLRPIPVTGDDELALLTTSFNTMLGALAESQERQRRLVGDAGHELRTPLTSLRTNLELLLASEKPGAPKLSAEDRQEIYDDVQAQIAEMTTLIGDLVELAREDAPQAVHEPVDMVELVERALDRARRRAAGQQFLVSLQPWYLLGEAHALERAVLNLLDNAVKFTPADGVVRLEMKPVGDGTMLIEVADSGPGIAEADLPHVFERFYRSSEARTLPGSGLGLAIVAQAVERHGGRAYAGRAPEGGALMTLRLPGRPSPA
ncbi:HAMP domain-containing sensor histidine kinase [Kutzneria kofuensis]|nr:HAMP domain-containing sensor histidine kinase [Kutzneria kofuensis]